MSKDKNENPQNVTQDEKVNPEVQHIEVTDGTEEEETLEPEIVIEEGEKDVEIPVDLMKDGRKMSEIIAELEAKLAKAQEDNDSYKNENLRLQAEFINFRKRNEKEKYRMIQFAKEDLIKNFLPVVDDFERTLKAIEKTDNLTAIKEGIGLVNNNMLRMLGKLGVKPIDSKGVEFSMNYHEAITSVPVPDDAMKGIVLDEIQKGYTMGEKVLRFAKVVVGE